MEDQLKAVEWARKQKKKILEKNYKDNNPPPVWITGVFVGQFKWREESGQTITSWYCNSCSAEKI